MDNILKDYCTDAVEVKLAHVAPMTNSQRNETLDSVVGSKTPKKAFMVTVIVTISV